MHDSGVRNMAKQIVKRDMMLVDIVSELAYRPTPYSDFYIREVQSPSIRKAMDMVGIAGKFFPVVCTAPGKHTLPKWRRDSEQWADRMNLDQ